MRRRAACLLLAITLASAANARERPARENTRPPAGPPHAWLFGAWTGGLFPVIEGMAAQDCKAQTTVIFAQDVVGHTSLLGSAMTRRLIETVRTSADGAEFRFTPDPADRSGFGCEDPNVLHVARADKQTITFPHCSEFPFPLERCPTK